MNVNQLDLNLLIALDALLTERNVTRAAERIGVSQSTMSGSLLRLRRFFGDVLLVRVGRDYCLTEMAEELQIAVREVMFLIEARIARRHVFDPATDPHTFTIAATDYAMIILIHPLLERLADEARGVTIHLSQYRSTGVVFDLLSRGSVDLAITSGTNLAMPNEVVLTERWVCAISRDNPEVGEVLSREQYFELPHLAFATDVTMSTSMGEGDRQVLSMGEQRNIQVRCESFAALPFLLSGTHLVTLIQERLGRKLCDTADVRLLEPPIPLDGFSLRAMWHPSRSSDPALLWLRESLREVAAAL
jgi:DNA-binding transcriptional LysR family regulator